VGLDQAVEVIEVVFAVKGTAEHATSLDKPLSRIGLGADALGALQMAGEWGASKWAGISPTSFSSYSSPAKRIQGFGTPIIGAALLAVNAMQLTCGFGDPETGDRFEKGSSGFNAISDTLKSGTPTDQWHGSGSESYSSQNERQQERATTMSKIDSAVKGIIENQAKQVEATRDLLDVVATSMTICIPVAIAIGKIPPTGPAQQMAFETGVVAGAMPVAYGAVTRMLAQVSANAMKFGQAASAYREVSAGAKPSGAPPSVMSPPGGNTTSKPWSPSGGSSTGTGVGSINV
jgi:EspA/EspE family